MGTPIGLGGTDGTSANVSDLLRKAAKRFPDRTAIITGDHRFTWAELDDAVDRGVDALTGSGLSLGDRAIISLPTGPGIAAAMFAVARAGLVAVPVAPHRVDLEPIGRKLGAAAALSSQPFDGVHLTEDDVAQWFGSKIQRDLQVGNEPSLRADGRPDRHPEPRGGGEDIAVLARAASTDRPVMVSHRAILAAVAAILTAPGLRLRSSDRVVLVLPLYHLAGWVTAFLPLCEVGGTAVVPATPATGESWLETVVTAIRSHRVTLVPGAPSLYRRLRGARDLERGLASVRLMTSGAAPLEPDDFAAIRNITGQPVWEGYGISESGSVVASSLMTGTSRPGSVGRPLTGISVRIISDDGEVLRQEPDVPSQELSRQGQSPAESSPAESTPAESAAAVSQESAAATRSRSGAPSPPDPPAGADPTPAANSGIPEAVAGKVPDRRRGAAQDPTELADFDPGTEVGRIAIHGRTLFSGYWPTGEGGPGPDGWFLTGDVGYVDGLGELHLVDRASETIRIAGFTVYPREVEQVLIGHPYVRDAAVIGAPGRAGESVMAVIVAMRGTRPTQSDLDDYTATILPPFKRPGRYVLVERLPRNELGRIDRDAVRRLYRPAERAERAEPADPADAPPQGPAASGGPETESAAPLQSLGTRLPGIGGRRARSETDSDDDLF